MAVIHIRLEWIKLHSINVYLAVMRILQIGHGLHNPLTHGIIKINQTEVTNYF